MNISEFSKEIENINNDVMKSFYDDEQEGTVYLLESYNRHKNDKPIETEIFRKYEDVKWAMRYERSKATFAADDDNNIEKNEDFLYWRLKKYFLVSDNYVEILSGLFSFTGELISWMSLHPSFNEISKREFELRDKLDNPFEFETGDVVKVQRIPVNEDIYAIYGIDKGTNKCYILWRKDDGELCSEECSTLKLDKALYDSDDWLTETAKKIKENSTLFSELVDSSVIYF